MGLLGDILNSFVIHWFDVGGDALRRKHHAERALSRWGLDRQGILEALVAIDPWLGHNAREARSAYLPVAQIISEEIRYLMPISIEAVTTLIDRALEETNHCSADSSRVEVLAKAIVRRIEIERAGR